jgi:hypothetical protein
VLGVIKILFPTTDYCTGGFSKETGNSTNYLIQPASTKFDMTTHFITVEIDIQETPAQLLDQIEAQLRSTGEPLRWAITNVDPKRQKAIVEAIVTLESDTPA